MDRIARLVDPRHLTVRPIRQRGVSRCVSTAGQPTWLAEKIRSTFSILRPSPCYLGPFALLPLPTARALWMTILQIALVGLPLAAAWSFRWSMTGRLRAAAVALGLFSLPGFLVVLHGDVAAVVTLAIMLSLAALHRRREAAAGLLAARHRREDLNSPSSSWLTSTCGGFIIDGGPLSDG